MKHFATSVAAAALTMCSVAASAAPVAGHDISRFLYQKDRNTTILNDARHRKVESVVARMEKDAPARFVKPLEATAADGTYTPDYIFEGKDLSGDIDGPDGELWFYQGTIKYEYIQHNEYFTEALPQAFEVSFYNSRMELCGTIKDTFELKDDESRVRQVDILPIITRNYFNQDDKYEVAVSVLVNPKPYGIRPYTYIYSLDGESEANGDSKYLTVINGIVNDVIDASNGGDENVLMTFIREYNDSGLLDEDFYGSEDASNTVARENFWKFNLGNKMDMKVYGRADANGDLSLLFEKTIVYYQVQGNQQDDMPMINLIKDGKPVIVYPYYENVFYEPFYSNQDDMSQRLPNNLIIEVYEQPAIGQPFALKQTTKIPVAKTADDDVIFSYYGVGSFRYLDDIVFNGDKADFYIIRRDYVASSDTERHSFFAYNHDGTLKKSLFENIDSHMAMADLPGFDPMELFIQYSPKGYIFNFYNMRTFETELSLNHGLMLDGPDGEPDYIMANIERTLSADGKTFYYVAEMRTPGYDDINDINYMRVVWLNRDGSFNHMDQVNMGNDVNYATLFLASEALQPDFFHSDAKQEYMMLIKRAVAGTETGTEEQMLIAQIADKQNPEGRNLLLLGNSPAGPLNRITPLLGAQNRLSVTYGDTGGTVRTTHFYNLPLDGVSGVENVPVGGSGDITVNGNTVVAEGAIEVFSLQGVRVAAGVGSVTLDGLAEGLYIARTANAAVKVAVK